jgi:hypothetical protein
MGGDRGLHGRHHFSLCRTFVLRRGYPVKAKRCFRFSEKFSYFCNGSCRKLTDSCHAQKVVQGGWAAALSGV